MWLTIEQVREEIRKNSDPAYAIPIEYRCCECRLVFRTARNYCKSCHSLNIKPTQKSSTPPN